MSSGKQEGPSIPGLTQGLYGPNGKGRKGGKGGKGKDQNN